MMYENFRQYVIEGDKICDKDLYGNKTGKNGKNPQWNYI